MGRRGKGEFFLERLGEPLSCKKEVLQKWWQLTFNPRVTRRKVVGDLVEGAELYTGVATNIVCQPLQHQKNLGSAT